MRRRVGLLHSMVNCGPAKRQCLPVLAPAQAFVRAGERRGKCGMRIRSSRLIRAVAFLLGCLALGSRLLCCSTDVPCVLRVPVIAFLSPRIALGSRLLFVLRQTGRLAVSRVPVPPGRDRHSCVLGASVRLSAFCGFTSGLAVSLWRSRRVTGTRGRSYEGDRAGGAAFVRFAQPHWLCCAFRREYVGAPRPKPAPKSLRLSGLSSRCGGVMLVRIRVIVTRAHG